MPDVQSLIVQAARRHGIDPRAALAVASVEGGVKFGAVGDNGTSYGPFQLHVGGALPKGKGASWANSAAGIDYAVGRMAASGAKGLTGKDAVAAIVSKFERPAAPGAEIEKAWGRYGQFSSAAAATKGAAAQAFQQGPAGITAAPNPMAQMTLAQQAAGMMLQRSQAAVAGQPVDEVAQLQALALTRKQLAEASMNVAQSEASAQKYGGTTAGEPDLNHGGSDQLSTVLQTAAAQIGKPYVWGGETPREGGFDCSGLIDYAYRKAGIKLPGRLTTQTALGMGVSVKGKAFRPGDMLITNGGQHMVMYVGHGQVIAAPHRGEVVQYQPVSRFQGDIVDVRRVLK